ncbi:MULTISPECIES: hypothetical protein [unclassified Tenacibaculum]|uniref:hypothetical protein n=1 Tax=unclassified Tenacibaculum TaxID=2635139 RepID=UPI001F1EA98D|nr:MULTISPECIES: hypothetical protein [unclassified Tenacibaculum]MCF2875562.1 hypothetical protein [Tenacibaculum sp. Cn5-1]MCF2935638.1 hypothetical protein [Tenacibaculum sp. Cn5-34]MCG7512198.1 hypothetical protein [Tenacibaculum sp. Cn5-46]
MKNTSNYFIGAYYLVKLKPIDFGGIKGSKVFTCSRCINDSFFDDWAISWTTVERESLEDTKLTFNLTDNNIEEIHTWVDKKLDEEKLGWMNTFSDLETLIEYKESFFSNDSDYEILSISFSEEEISQVLEVTKPIEPNTGEVGIYNKLKNKEKNLGAGSFLGYDIIGIEEGGDFHSFHCNDLVSDLKNKFDLKINEFGLFEKIENWNEIKEYLKNPMNAEEVPWFYVKVNRIKK